MNKEELINKAVEKVLSFPLGKWELSFNSELSCEEKGMRIRLRKNNIISIDNELKITAFEGNEKTEQLYETITAGFIEIAKKKQEEVEMQVLNDFLNCSL
jgi:uncharacterized pyridoxamine 5'-phosphate oxidase family protein